MELAAVIIALIASLATLVAVFFAWKTVLESAVGHRQAERARNRERLERLGEALEEVFFTFDPGPSVADHLWSKMRNRIKVMLVGFEDALPECSKVPYATSGTNARNSIHRVEIQNALNKLTNEDEADVVPKYPWSRRPAPRLDS